MNALTTLQHAIDYVAALRYAEQDETQWESLSAAESLLENAQLVAEYLEEYPEGLAQI